MTLPGVYSVIVPLPSVVVVVVVVSETCPHANGATTAKAMVKSIFLMISLSLSYYGDKSSLFRVSFSGQAKSLPPYWIRICVGPRMFLISSLSVLEEIICFADLGRRRAHEILDRHIGFSVR